MRIGYITNSVSRKAGGLFSCMVGLSRELSGFKGIDLDVIGFEDDSFATDVGAWGAVDCLVFRPRGFGALPYSRRMKTQVQSGDYHVLHTHGLWQLTSKYVYETHQARQVPYVVSTHGMLNKRALEVSSWKKKIAERLFETAHLKNASCIHALCESEYRAIREYGLSNPVCIIPNGVDLPEKFEEGRAPSTGCKILLFLGRVNPIKGIAETIRAWASVGLTDWSFVVAGWDQGNHQSDLMILCDELGVEHKVLDVEQLLEDVEGRLQCGRVLFVGAVYGESKNALLSRASAFILPSFSEGIPISVLEAWAYEVPVLMTPECNLAAGFDCGAAIRIEHRLPTDREQSIAGSLRRLRSISQDELAQMGMKGRSLVVEKYTWSVVATQFASVYRWLLGEGGQPDCVVFD